MVRRTSSGIDTPIHVVKKTGSSNDQSKCELISCVEVSQAAARGNQPAYECEHLLSVQKAEPFVPQAQLDEEVLHIMVSEFKWLKESRKREALSLRDQATANGACPVYPWLPQEGQSERFIHFSVVSGTTVAHYWCRFGRSIVSFDTITSLWKCACSPSKRSCVHKALAKWYCLQHFPGRLKTSKHVATESDDEIDEEFEEIRADVAESSENKEPIKFQAKNYPPTGLKLERMLQYLRQRKSIPVHIPQQLLNEAEISAISELVPAETHCLICSSCPPLSDPVLITRNGTVVALQGVRKGLCI